MTPETLKVAADTAWTLLTGFLVFFMNAGFGLVEAGLCRKKNATMILSKNFVVFAISTLGFFAVGFGLMFSDGGFLGSSGGLLLTGADNSPASGGAYQGIFGSLGWAGVPLLAKFFFELVFCGTSATIVSGSVNERMKYSSFLVFSLVLTAVIYPIAGHWVWGGGFLARAGMKDFSGSTVVHSVGGWAALAGIIALGPRLGRYPVGRKPTTIPGHNMGYVFLGGMILWLGWFGFNPGSTMSVDPEAISRIAVTTALSSAASTLVATLYAWRRNGKPDFSLTVNGCLAGLVSITAPCAFVTPGAALVIGIVAGVTVTEAVPLFDRLRLDDPVGATSVHLVHGVLGTLWVGVFGVKGYAGLSRDGLLRGGGLAQLGVQAEAVATVGLFAFVSSLAVWYALKRLMGLRVSAEDEHAGLDIAEMGMEAYPDAIEPESAAIA
ncbi:MAG TPA: ammonium transporter [Polyangia bacterium]|nr:ammonium transporter [Polyangia bacterium]